MGARDEASKKAEAQNVADVKQQLDNTGGSTGAAAALTRKQNELDTDAQREYQISARNMRREAEKSADAEVSDERCKEIRRKQVEKMKNGWGETDVQKKKKKKQSAKADEDGKDSGEMVDVSGIAETIRRGPGSAYEA